MKNNQESYHKTCPECEEYYFANRIDKIYCSNRCKNRFHNRKNRQKKLQSKEQQQPQEKAKEVLTTPTSNSADTTKPTNKPITWYQSISPGIKYRIQGMIVTIGLGIIFYLVKKNSSTDESIYFLPIQAESPPKEESPLPPIPLEIHEKEIESHETPKVETQKNPLIVDKFNHVDDNTFNPNSNFDSGKTL